MDRQGRADHRRRAAVGARGGNPTRRTSKGAARPLPVKQNSYHNATKREGRRADSHPEEKPATGRKSPPECREENTFSRKADSVEKPRARARARQRPAAERPPVAAAASHAAGRRLRRGAHSHHAGDAVNKWVVGADVKPPRGRRGAGGDEVG